MVGLLGLGRRSPSTEIRRSDASVPIASPRSAPPSAEQTPPVSASDKSPGGFFSLPHWTRRILPTSSPTRKSLAGIPHERSANLRNISPHSLLLEKDLPPIPSPHTDTDITTHEPKDQLHDTRMSIAIQHVTDTPPQPTFYLDVYRNAPVIPPPQTNFPRSGTENILRKSKSTLSLRPEYPSSDGQQRTRGVSMTQMFMKAKRTSTLPTSTSSSPTPLPRKSSFWSRKFSTSSPQHPPESPSPAVFKSTSPLQVEFTTSPDLLARSRSNSIGAGLSRRQSERTNRHTPITRITTSALPQSPVFPNGAGARPSTAIPDSRASHRSLPRRPTTADSATPSRSRSFFALSQPTSPLSNNDPPSANSTSRPKTSPSSRPRSSTNPPLLHRLSVNLFTSSSGTKTGTFNGVASPLASRSPRPSLSQIPADVLKPRAAESPETFVNRLKSIVSKADIASVLASAGDTIFADSLKLFLEHFGFHGDPLDVALRRLLMDVGLPRETQQIDRVIQAFADRYLSCNPDLFTSKDHPYILAFSLIMLHTDVFNKSNRRKMSKADYLKNTALPGLIPEVLDCFYDNIVFAPFIFIEDPLDSEAIVEGSLTRPSTSSGIPSPMIQAGNSLLSRPKIDPYYLITNNLLDQLRVDVDAEVSLENPFRWDGTDTSWDYDEILQSFVRGHAVQITSADVRTAPFFGLSVGLSVGIIPVPPVDSLGSVSETPPVSEVRTIKLTKVAVLSRKDDTLEGGKKPSNRKWRPYSVALTKSQLLLFRDLSWSATLLSWNDSPSKPPIPSASFKPDEIISLNNTLAVLDRSYSKHLNTFRLTTGDGRHMLFQTTEEKEMNEWISRINYASAFKTTGVRMRSLAMTGKVLELTGIAAATSHLHDLQLPYDGQPRMLTWDHPDLAGAMDGLPGISCNRCCADVNGCQIGLADISAPEVEGASQFKETFDTVKAELAAACVSAGDLPIAEKVSPVGTESPRLASRSHTVHTRVEDLENRICAANAQIDSSMHIARNIAILAPFQKSTRDRLQDIIQTVSKKIHAMRLDVTKLICHRNILLNDFAAEERNFRQATSLALQAATETLHQRYSEYTSQSLISSQGRQSKSSSQDAISTCSQSFDSPTDGTFRTALDFGPDWPSSGEAFATGSLWGTSVTTDSPVIQGCDNSPGGYPSPGETSCLSLSATNQSLPDTSSYGGNPILPDFAEEQAEEWNKTRAAKRVSLVKLPSDLRMTVIPPKSGLHGEGGGSFNEEPAFGSRT